MDLILNTYGSYLNRDQNGFVISSGDSKQRVPTDGISSIQISNGAIISSDAVLFAIENEIEIIFMTTERKENNAGNMLFFVMYDIEDNRVRNLVSKYLVKNGCTRIQKSIFLADLPSSKYEQIRNDLTEVQAAYENLDSILVVPISTDYLKSMKIIGKNISVDVITKSKNTLFF